MSSDKLDVIYAYRFSREEREDKDKIWRVLCESYFQRFIRPDDTVLDIACGQGEFIRHIRCGRKIAADLNREVAAALPPEVQFIHAPAHALDAVASGSVDVVFVSNFFEHLEHKSAMDAVLQEIMRVLKRGGKLVNMQPNVRIEPGRYWDYYDHHLALSDRSAAEGLIKNGFLVEMVIPRFIPFTTKSPLPKNPLLVRLYLSLPWIWRFVGGQFLIVGRKP
jgi:ubiquinone/menaquinone biosynthesis C-methylase UbiE